jgi:hypothetical protein
MAGCRSGIVAWLDEPSSAAVATVEIDFVVVPCGFSGAGGESDGSAGEASLHL